MVVSPTLVDALAQLNRCRAILRGSTPETCAAAPAAASPPLTADLPACCASRLEQHACQEVQAAVDAAATIDWTPQRLQASPGLPRLGLQLCSGGPYG